MHDEISSTRERAIIIGATVRGGRPLLSLEDSLDELELLAKTAGIEVVERVTQTINQVDPSTFIGSGKVKEVIDLLKEYQVKTVIFDEELSPRHQRELNKQFGEDVKLLDRSALILDIFAQHASTREGALQVELAQYEYRLPRLTRQWTHLARQGGGGAARGGSGGVGLRGPGETQLEVDKREIGRKITKLKQDLDLVRQQRSQHRVQRRKTGIPVIALVGYTNAGKSTLLNALSNSLVYVADQLFATLDPTTRRIELPSGRYALITDTVGFIQKLPTTLIAAFRATLEEIAEADLLLHVVDGSHPNVLSHIEAVEDTLAELDVPTIPRILVWNKSDKYEHETLPDLQEQGYVAQLRTSAFRKTGLEELKQTIEEALSHTLEVMTLCIPYQHGELVSQLFQVARVRKQEHQEVGVLLEVELPQSLRELYEPFRV
jgi:GTP-binding protein HflX